MKPSTGFPKPFLAVKVGLSTRSVYVAGVSCLISSTPKLQGEKSLLLGCPYGCFQTKSLGSAGFFWDLTWYPHTIHDTSSSFMLAMHFIGFLAVKLDFHAILVGSFSVKTCSVWMNNILAFGYHRFRWGFRSLAAVSPQALDCLEQGGDCEETFSSHSSRLAVGCTNHTTSTHLKQLLLDDLHHGTHLVLPAVVQP